MEDQGLQTQGGELHIVCSKRTAEEFDISDPLEELRELLELHDSGESVVWANGTSAKKARLRLAEEERQSIPHQPDLGGRLEL